MVSAQKDWITGDQMQAELAAAGASISDFQIERWRRQELLPRPCQVGLGRGHGSYVKVPPDSAAQAVEIARLFGIREKRDWVGWRLWMQGYCVGDRYWRPHLEQARTALANVRAAGAKYEAINSKEGIDLGQLHDFALAISKGTPFHAPFKRLDRQLLETIIGFGNEIVAGEFSGFSADEDAKPNNDELHALISVFGLAAAERDEISGQKIDFANSIESVLRDISLVLGNLRPGAPFDEPSIELRREFEQVKEIGLNLYRSMSWLFGRAAFGLGTLNRIAANPSIAIEATMLAAWVELRQISKALLSASEIDRLHKVTTELLAMSNLLQAQFAASSTDSPGRISNATRKAIAKPISN